MSEKAMDFPRETCLPRKMIFQKGAISGFAAETGEFGPRGLIVHGNSLARSGRLEEIKKQFSSSGKPACFCRAAGEPELAEITRVIAAAKTAGAGWIAGIGGGSVLDLAKAAAGLFHAREAPGFYQEGGELEEQGIPFLAVPTTAGTGSEATPNAVIINREKKTKLSIRDPGFLARKIILDVELLKGIPAPALKHSALDALVQGYESYVSRYATWFSEQLALKAIALVNENVVPAVETGAEENLSALLLGSCLTGMALTSSRLGVIHGLAHPLGVLHDLPHGLVCAAALVPSIKLNRKAMGPKYETISAVLGMDFQERSEQLLRQLRIESPFPGRALLEKEKIIADTLASGSTAANPKPVDRADVEFLLRELWGETGN